MTREKTDGCPEHGTIRLSDRALETTTELIKSGGEVDRTADESDLPDPEKVADELAAISRRLDGELSSDEHAYLNASDHYLRYVVPGVDQGGEGG